MRMLCPGGALSKRMRNGRDADEDEDERAGNASAEDERPGDEPAVDEHAEDERGVEGDRRAGATRTSKTSRSRSTAWSRQVCRAWKCVKRTRAGEAWSEKYNNPTPLEASVDDDNPTPLQGIGRMRTSR